MNVFQVQPKGCGVIGTLAAEIHLSEQEVSNSTGKVTHMKDERISRGQLLLFLMLTKIKCVNNTLLRR